LLVASLTFYAMWVPVYVSLLLLDVLINYALLRRMQSGKKPRRWLIVSVVFSLSVLAYFKYAFFLAESAAPLFRALGLSNVSPPEILLPLGISFYTFQMIGLQVDVYRKRATPPRGFGEYLLFLAFFPQLIAGPILRGSELFPQLRRCGRPDSVQIHRGLWLICWGLAKKVILADSLLAPFSDRAFANPGIGSAPEHLLAVYSFSFQIYFDFSGYTDIARGIGLLLGFELPKNFREPYLSRNPSEFWRRWHITLSEWLRDYLYIPLGGNRKGKRRMLLNLLLTMVLGGLWHGASWNFVFWGGVHGILLVAHRLVARVRIDEGEQVRFREVPACIATFHLVSFAWIPFRAESFEDAFQFGAALFREGYGGAWPAFQCVVVLVCVALHPIERLARTTRGEITGVQSRAILVAQGLAMGVLLALALVFGGVGGEFIYFQF